MQQYTQILTDATTIFFIAEYVWVIAGNSIIFSLMNFWHRIFSILGEKPYLTSLTSLFIILLFTAYSLRHELLYYQIPVPSSVSTFGLILLFAGLLGDTWAFHTLGWKTALNTQSIITPKEKRTLVTRGPYALSRNPLYVSDSLALFGLLLFTGYAALMPLLILYLLHVLTQTRMEEQELSQTFGTKFTEYQKHTPRFI